MEQYVDLIRHGEPVGGARYRGSRDDPLSERGWQQMRSALHGRDDWQSIVSSPLSRCLDFATEVGQRLGLPVHVDDDLREVGFGAWEGLSRADVENLYPGAVEAFYQDPESSRPAGAEPLDLFRSRVVAAWERCLREHHRDRTLLVAHAGVIRAIITHLAGMRAADMYRLRISNAGVSRVIIPHGRRPPQIAFVNRIKD